MRTLTAFGRRAVRRALGVALAWTSVGGGAALAADKKDSEFTLVPVVGGDSDVGVGVGYVASYARLAPHVKPYVWRLESAGALTGRFGSSPVTLGYLDDYILLVVPHAFRPRLRFEAELGFTAEPGLDYFGVGNASRVRGGRDSADPYFNFGRSRTNVRLAMTYRAPNGLVLLWGIRELHNRLQIKGKSLLAEQRALDANATRLPPIEPEHEVLSFSYGVGWDSRDNEVSTHRGQYHTLRVDLAPGGSGSFPHSWLRTGLTLRGYLPLVARRITLAGRLVVDALAGAPPFYELSRFDDSEAIGGGRGVRGVPAGRYYGRMKAFTNLELRTHLFEFRAFKKQNTFGITGFFDTGRVVSDLPASPALDGRSLGLKFGTGLGARVTAGESFVLRGDVAWSPDARPIGAYLLAGELF